MSDLKKLRDIFNLIYQVSTSIAIACFTVLIISFILK